MVSTFKGRIPPLLQQRLQPIQVEPLDDPAVDHEGRGGGHLVEPRNLLMLFLQLDPLGGDGCQLFRVEIAQHFLVGPRLVP